MMVPFAGYDPSDKPFASGAIVPLSLNGKRSMAYRMFKSGKDTAQIAMALGVQENLVERWITRERCKRLGLPNPYEVKS